MIKQAKDLVLGDNLYLLDNNNKLLIKNITGIREFSPNCIELECGFKDILIIGKDCTSFSYSEYIAFLNKENVISWLEGITEKLNETIKNVKESN